MSCRLEDTNFILAPQDKGEPPSWVPAIHGEQVEWVDRELFDKIKARRHDKPCELCTTGIKERCEIYKQKHPPKKTNPENIVFDYIKRPKDWTEEEIVFVKNEMKKVDFPCLGRCTFGFPRTGCDSQCCIHDDYFIWFMEQLAKKIERRKKVKNNE